MDNQHVRHVCQSERKYMREIRDGLIMDDPIIEALVFSLRVIREIYRMWNQNCSTSHLYQVCLSNDLEESYRELCTKVVWISSRIIIRKDKSLSWFCFRVSIGSTSFPLTMTHILSNDLKCTGSSSYVFVMDEALYTAIVRELWQRNSRQINVISRVRQLKNSAVNADTCWAKRWENTSVKVRCVYVCMRKIISLNEYEQRVLLKLTLHDLRLYSETVTIVRFTWKWPWRLSRHSYHTRIILGKSESSTCVVACVGTLITHAWYTISRHFEWTLSKAGSSILCRRVYRENRVACQKSSKSFANPWNVLANFPSGHKDHRYYGN